MIPISLDVDNKSIRKIKYFKILLYQVKKYYDFNFNLIIYSWLIVFTF